MKRKIACAIALVVGFGLVGTGFAQGRHDDKPHGYDKAKAESAANGTAKTEAQPSTGGRHD